MVKRYKEKYPKEADQLYKMQHRELPDGWDKDLPVFPADAKGMAGRGEFQGLERNRAQRPLVGRRRGRLDSLDQDSHRGRRRRRLPSRNSRRPQPPLRRARTRNGRCLNGLALVKVRPYGSGFFIFSDFSRPAIRLGAIMEIPVIYIFTHDSIGVGEDGPTHQPVEQLAGLRAIPGLICLRPGDANEIVEAWRVIMKLDHEPAILILTRKTCRPSTERSTLRRRDSPKGPTSWPTRPTANPT